MLSSLDQLNVPTATSIETFNFSALHTSMTLNLLKSRISNLVHHAFGKRDGSVTYTFIKVTISKGINGGGGNTYTANVIRKMIEVLVHSIFVQSRGCLFRQVIGIPLGTNCAPLLADVFRCSYENVFLDNMIRSGLLAIKFMVTMY